MEPQKVELTFKDMHTKSWFKGMHYLTDTVKEVKHAIQAQLKKQNNTKQNKTKHTE